MPFLRLCVSKKYIPPILIFIRNTDSFTVQQTMPPIQPTHRPPITPLFIPPKCSRRFSVPMPILKGLLLEHCLCGPVRMCSWTQMKTFCYGQRTNITCVSAPRRGNSGAAIGGNLVLSGLNQFSCLNGEEALRQFTTEFGGTLSLFGTNSPSMAELRT